MELKGGGSKWVMVNYFSPSPQPSPVRDCVAIAACHCETALSRCGNLIFLIVYEIALLIVFARKDNCDTVSKGGWRGDLKIVNKILPNPPLEKEGMKVYLYSDKASYLVAGLLVC